MRLNILPIFYSLFRHTTDIEKFLRAYNPVVLTNSWLLQFNFRILFYNVNAQQKIGDKNFTGTKPL